MRTRIVAIPICLGLGMALAGCSDSSAPRSVLHVSQINDNQALASDVLNLGDDGTPSGDDYVVEDVVLVEIRSAPHDPVLSVSPTGPYGHVVIDRYEVRFEGEEEIDGFSGGLGWTVPYNSIFEGALTVVSAGQKGRAPLISLQQGGEIRATAHITFFGHEATSDAPVKFEAILPVNFADWTD